MTILFAENFETLFNSDGVIEPNAFVRRHPGSRYTGGGAGVGFQLVSQAVTTGSIGGGNLLYANLGKAPVGDKYEIIFGFNGASSTTTSGSGTINLRVFGLNFQAPVQGNASTTPITLEGLDVGLRAIQGQYQTATFHAILTRTSNNQWDLITIITYYTGTGEELKIRRKNVLGSFTLNNKVLYSRTTDALQTYTMPWALSFVAVLADTPDKKMTELSFVSEAVASSEAAGWTPTEGTLDSAVEKARLTSLDPAIVADAEDATVTYTAPTTHPYNILALAAVTEEPRIFVKAATPTHSMLLRYNGATPQNAATPSLGSGPVTLTLKESDLITWLDYDKAVDSSYPSLVPDRVAPNAWRISAASVLGDVLNTVLPDAGPYGSGAIAAAGGGGNVPSLILPGDFPTRGAVIQVWFKPTTTSQQYIFGLSVGSTVRAAFNTTLTGGNIILNSSINGGAYAQIASTPAGADGWAFLTVRIGVPVGANMSVETWLNGVKSTTVSQATYSSSTYTLSLCGAHSAHVAPKPQIGNLYMVSGTEFPAPVDRPDTASPWPAL